MGIKSFFENFQENKVQRKLDKLVRRLCEKYGQDYERYSAADELAAMEGEAAIYGLLQRFQVQMPKIIEDESEKKYVYQLVLRKGILAIPPILHYIREKENLAYPLQLLKELAGPEKTRLILIEALGEFSPEYNRVPEKKIDIIHALGEYHSQDVMDVLFPFLQDPNDDVALSVMDILVTQKDQEEAIRNAFLEILISPDERPRLRRRILELMKDLRWKVAGYRTKVEAILPDEFYLDKKGHVKRAGEE